MKTIINSSKRTKHAWFKVGIAILTCLIFLIFPSCQKDKGILLNQESFNGPDIMFTSEFLSTPSIYYGPETFTRKTGAPVVETRILINSAFVNFNSDFVLQIKNGSDKKTRVSSAEIKIDGVLVVGPSDFSKNVSFITKQISGLTPESKLEVKLNSAPGSFIELWIEGTLKVLPPTVSTDEASAITSTSATCGGNVTSDGGALVEARGVCWNTSANPTISDSHTTDGTGTGIFTSSITGLTQNTTYYVRAYATNSVGTSYGAQVSFVTANLLPIVYFGSSNGIFYALNAQTGSLIWNYTSTSSFAYSSPCYYKGTVYAGGTDNGTVYAFDALNGSIKWQTTISTTGVESDPFYMDGVVYIGTNDDDLYALDASTGQVIWTFHTGGNVSSSPTGSNGVVYFGSSDGKLYALYASTGSLKWYYQTGAMINQSAPYLVNNVVYVGSRDSYLHAVNADNGTMIWKYYTNGISLEQSSPTVANGIVYIGSWYNVPSFTTKGSLYAVNTSGVLVWEKLINTGISSSPWVADGKVYITCDDNKIHALDAVTGASLWEKVIVANDASPAVGLKTVYVGGGGTGYFYALETTTGAEIWKFPTPNGPMTSRPLIVYSL